MAFHELRTQQGEKTTESGPLTPGQTVLLSLSRDELRLRLKVEDVLYPLNTVQMVDPLTQSYRIVSRPRQGRSIVVEANPDHFYPQPLYNNNQGLLGISLAAIGSDKSVIEKVELVDRPSPPVLGAETDLRELEIFGVLGEDPNRNPLRQQTVKVARLSEPLRVGEERFLSFAGAGLIYYQVLNGKQVKFLHVVTQVHTESGLAIYGRTGPKTQVLVDRATHDYSRLENAAALPASSGPALGAVVLDAQGYIKSGAFVLAANPYLKPGDVCNWEHDLSVRSPPKSK